MCDEILKHEILFLVLSTYACHSKDTNIKTLRRLILEGGFNLVDQLLLHGVADVKGGCGVSYRMQLELEKLFESLRP